MENIEFDSNGVVINNYENIGVKYNPAYVAWFGLMCLEKYLETKNRKYLKQTQIQINWLMANATSQNNYLFYYYNFDWKLSNTNIKAPWISSMAQGLIASLLFRYYYLTKKKKYLHLAIKSINCFDLPVIKGGVKRIYNGSLFFEEYPTKNPSLVFDGFLFSVLAVYDASRFTETPRYKVIFENCIKSITKNKHLFIYDHVWTFHGIGPSKLINSPMYNELIKNQLVILYYLSNNLELKEIIRRLNLKLSVFLILKLEIFSQYQDILLQKNKNGRI